MPEQATERRTIGITDTYHGVIKLVAASRGTTLTEVVETMLFTELQLLFQKDPTLWNLIRELVNRDETQEEGVRNRTLALLDQLKPEG